MEEHIQIREIYSLDNSKGVTLVIKRRKDLYLGRRDEYQYTPSILINPSLDISDAGILHIKGKRHEYETIRIKDGWTWYDTPIRDLNKNWKDMIYYSEEDIVKKDIVTWTGWFIFKKRHVEKDVEHLKAGSYLKKKGYDDSIKVSNFKIDE